MNNTATPLKPPFHKQETRYSCVPACLRMVLGSFDVDISESVLRTRCDCTPYGTDALMCHGAVVQGHPVTRATFPKRRSSSPSGEAL